MADETLDMTDEQVENADRRIANHEAAGGGNGGGNGGDGRTVAERIDPREHIGQDDERYDGFTMRELWIVTGSDHTGSEGLLMVPSVLSFLFELTPGPAMASDARRVRHLREFAQFVADTGLGGDITMRHLVLDDASEEKFTPKERPQG